MMSEQSAFQDDVPEQSSTGQYRLYFLDSIGCISGGPYEFEASSDDLALRIAEAWLEGRGAELWRGRAKLKTFPASPPPF